MIKLNTADTAYNDITAIPIVAAMTKNASSGFIPFFITFILIVLYVYKLYL